VSSRAKRCAATAALGALLFARGSAHAETPPNAWQAAIDPAIKARYALHLDVSRRLASQGAFDREAAFDAFRRQGLERLRDELLDAGADDSPDVRLRFDLGRILVLLDDYPRAARVFEAALQLAPNHPMAEEALWQLAISYAHGDVERELATYERYLALAVRAESRSIAYSNRAEAEMRQGRLEEAIDDARYAVSLATNIDTAVLAGFDLGVALDRYGDAAGAAQAVKEAVSAARSAPRGLHMILSDGQGVFYVPDYDKYWYRAMALAELAREEADAVEALGFWLAAAASWEHFVALADPADRWLSLAVRHRDEARGRSAAARKAAGSRSTARPSARD
jgi:tetratricopeptide (TPR) repeat protein